MKYIFLNIAMLLFVMTIMFSACTNENPDNNGTMTKLVNVKINIGTLPMDNINVEPHSRATIPLPPEIENPMKTLAVVQFDSEGNMLKLNDNTDYPYFHYIILTSDDNPYGQINTVLDVNLYSGKGTHICLIANMSEKQISDLIFDSEKNRYLLWNEFRVKTITLDYILEGKEDVGHVKEIYMFGYFEGELNSNGMAVSGTVEKQLSIAMSRLIARLEMYIRLGDGVKIPEGYKIYTGFTGIGRQVYLVPGAAEYLEERVHEHVMLHPVDRTELISNTSEIGKTTPLYFYMAPHIVEEDINKVTKFIIWCVDEDFNPDNLIVFGEDGDPKPNQYTNYYEIMMCNDPLNENPNVDGAYWLNRNSLYHVNITLTNKIRSCMVGNGEYLIDLNELINNVNQKP